MYKITDRDFLKKNFFSATDFFMIQEKVGKRKLLFIKGLSFKRGIIFFWIKDRLN